MTREWWRGFVAASTGALCADTDTPIHFVTVVGVGVLMIVLIGILPLPRRARDE